MKKSVNESYNIWAEVYDSAGNKTRDLEKIVAKNILSNYSFKKLIELGCGTGKNTEWLLEKADEIIALDFSKKMLAKASDKIKSKKVLFKQTDLNKPWNVENKYADFITCSLVLEHISNLVFIFGQAYEKLKQDGKFYICEIHPFKQYLGSKARYETESGIEELEVYTHHISDYLNAAKKNNFKLLELNEWFDNDEESNIPRLISFVFIKK